MYVYDVNTSEWLQTLPLKKAKPACRDGSLVLTMICDAPKLVYIKDMEIGKCMSHLGVMGWDTCRSCLNKKIVIINN